MAAFFPENAGYEYRIHQWALRLREHGLKVSIKSTFSREQFTKWRDANSTLLYLIPMYKRFWQVLTSVFYDEVIVRRELVLFNDYGRLFLDKLLLAIHPTAVLDFDDDLSPAKKEPRTPTFFERLLLGTGNKFNESLALYKRFLPGSAYLAGRIMEQQPTLDPSSILIVPTCVDYDRYPMKKYGSLENKLVFGWIGGNGNQHFLQELIQPLHQLALERPEQIEFHVISGNVYTIPFNPAFKLVNKSWSLATQIEDLLQIDVGVMPLVDAAEERGKCGFKLIQYMGLGIVSMASAITINREIISEQSAVPEGFLVPPGGDWLEVLRKVADQKTAFDRIGKQAHAKIKQRYSFLANERNYIEFLTTTTKAGSYVRHSRDIQL